MPFFKSLPNDCGVRHIVQMNKPVGRALVELHEALMRADSPLSPAQHELIAAFVSGLNACHYCYGVHSQTAQAFGVQEATLKALVSDLDSAPVEAKMRPILAYARKLTLTPGKMVKADAEAVFAAGWSARALHDAPIFSASEDSFGPARRPFARPGRPLGRASAAPRRASSCARRRCGSLPARRASFWPRRACSAPA